MNFNSNGVNMCDVLLGERGARGSHTVGHFDCQVLDDTSRS